MPRTLTEKVQIDESEGFKELTYNPDGTVAQLVLYVDDTKTVVLKTKVFTYTGDQITQVQVTNEDGSVVTKDFLYTGDDLDSVES